MAKEGSAEATIRDIKRKTRRKCSAKEKVWKAVEGGEARQDIAEFCWRERSAKGLCCCPARESVREI
jgi:hypothetical protein